MTDQAAQIEISADNKTKSPSVRPGGWGRRLAKILFQASVAIVVVLVVVELFWKFSGSNQWTLIQDKDGIKLYTLKTPGVDMLQFKAIGRIHSTLPGVFAWMKDPDTCKNQGCTESYEISRAGEQIQYNYFQYDMAPFGKRDFVIGAMAYQNPDTRQLLITIAAAPDKVPPREGYLRVTNMNNKWRITPLDNGQVEVEIENSMDPGGFMPTFLYNWKRPDIMYYILTHLESWVAKDKYQNAKFDFIKEKNNTASTNMSRAITTP
jgi:hypothetical protein